MVLVRITTRRAMPKTRKNVSCPVFGAPKQMSETVLPTYESVMKHYLFVRFEILQESKKEPSFADIANEVIKNIKTIWNKACLPVLSDRRIFQMLKDYHTKYRKVKKYPTSRPNSKSSSFLEEAKNKLFDICYCKCKDFGSCSCHEKVPLKERDFLNDQRRLRQMMIGGVDLVTTKSIKKRLERKLKTEKRKKCGSSETKCSATVLQTPNSSTSTDSETSEPEFSLKSKSVPVEIDLDQPSTSQMRVNLDKLSEVCDRTGVSDRAAAMIASAVLQDVGIVSKNDRSKVIDRCKIRRARKKKRLSVVQNVRRKKLNVKGIYFDGRKDKTIHYISLGSKLHRKVVVEEHIALVKEPGSEYLGHVSPTTGSAKDIKDCLLAFLEDKVDTSSLVAIGCDGTVVNTGRKNGVIAYIERHLGRPLQWFICMLHANELPLRHLLQYLDGSTTGPRGFSGEIGKSLQSCENVSIVNFQPIEVELPYVDYETISSDQKYLYEMCLAISSGTIKEDLSHKNPGPLCHSRWLTCANRILRLYAATEMPSRNLDVLATFVIKVYAPTWFNIKLKSSCLDGPKHLLEMIKRSRYLPEEILKIIDPVIERNSYFAHPENILLCMLNDERLHIRELSLRRILKSRETSNSGTSATVREFTVPKLNFNAESYEELINWQTCKVTEPPFTAQISKVELLELIKSVPKMNLVEFPCHTQAVERTVKLVTEASLAVAGTEARDGFIMTKLKSRSGMPNFNTKKEFN